MLRLRMLGGLAIVADDQPFNGVATQRRRLALLSLAAVAGESGISRDRVLGYLWPESDMESARHALTQALYALRRDLRAPDLFDGGSSDVRLNPAVITSDVAEFRAALRGGDPERAMGIYGGTFLDGYHISDAPEFERWIDDERAELARAAEHAVETLAAAATDRGQHRRAADWWRRLATLDPLSSRVALAFMRALVSAGDRAAALRHARVHETLLREQLQLPPDPEVLALAERLRSEAAALAERVAADGPGQAALLRGGTVLPEGAGPRPSIGPSIAHTTAVDRYQVEREIGRGRWSTVYLAHDVKHRRPVALKVLHREATSSRDGQRFARELLLLARLRHPHILPLYDSGQVGGLLYYVTPYVEGGSLRARLAAGGALPVGEALAIAREVAEALDYAHRHNAVHRDVTPEHVLLDAGHALVAGFGIARAIDTAFEMRLTEPGLVLGAPAYMSPEQARGVTTLDGRSDIYSLGCVLLEMLTGTPVPAPGPTRDAALETLPDAVRRVVATAVAAAPEDRFPSAGVLAKALAPVSR
jgi:DNA-binding SARP family transcriptional activator